MIVSQILCCYGDGSNFRVFCFRCCWLWFVALKLESVAATLPGIIFQTHQKLEKMSIGHSGGRTGLTTKVFLNVYDLHPQNESLHGLGFGIYHSGVEISGREYSFANGTGIFEIHPRTAPGANFREQLEIGHFEGGKDELNRVLDFLRDEFGPDDYDGFRRNCNHFSNALCWRLLHTKIPPYINRAAELLVCCCGCLLPRPRRTDGATNSSNDSSSSNFLLRKKDQELSIPAFHGAGNKLGSDSSNSFLGGNSLQQEDLTDRREKARKAAMARLGKSQQD